MNKHINKICLVGMLATFGLGWAAHRYYAPKPASQTASTEQTRTRTVTRIVERKDGTKETLIESVDNSTASRTVIKATKPQWLLGVGAAYNLPRTEVVYDVQASRRIIGPIFAGIRASTDGTVGVQALIEF